MVRWNRCSLTENHLDDAVHIAIDGPPLSQSMGLHYHNGMPVMQYISGGVTGIDGKLVTPEISQLLLTQLLKTNILNCALSI